MVLYIHYSKEVLSISYLKQDSNLTKNISCVTVIAVIYARYLVVTSAHSLAPRSGQLKQAGHVLPLANRQDFQVFYRHNAPTICTILLRSMRQ